MHITHDLAEYKRNEIVLSIVFPLSVCLPVFRRVSNQGLRSKEHRGGRKVHREVRGASY